jgi:hypothetical protein
MVYFRDDLCAFTSDKADGAWFHFWMRGGYDYWDETGWADASEPRNERDSGVGIPARWVDRFVLMRLAQLLVERSAGTTLEAMARELFSGPGNEGEDCLRQNQGKILDALRDLEARCLPPQRERV